MKAKTIQSTPINFTRPALITGGILLIPFIGTQVSREMNWSAFDFIVIGILLFGATLAYELISSRVNNSAYKIATGVAVVTAVLLMWVNLAVGIIGSEDNPANALYLGVLAAGLFGTIISQLKPSGMAKTLFVAAVLQMLVPVIAIVTINPAITSDPPGIVGVLTLNSFFAMLWTSSGILFQKASKVNSK